MIVNFWVNFLFHNAPGTAADITAELIQMTIMLNNSPFTRCRSHSSCGSKVLGVVGWKFLDWNNKEDSGFFKVNLEFRISGVTWKMKYQLVLETGNWKPGFLKPRFENPDSWLLSKKATINWEKSSKPGFDCWAL